MRPRASRLSRHQGPGQLQGRNVHTARWDHGVDLKGKRVGIIGTGSTAAQVVSEISGTVGNLTVFQRTPQWILDVPDKTYTESDKARQRGNQGLMDKLRERYSWLIRNTFTEAVSSGGWHHALLSWRVKRYLRKSARDPALSPYSWQQWVQEMAEPDLADFHRAPPQRVPATSLEEAA